MWQRLLGNASLYALLECCDRDLAEETRAGRCRVCGGPLHVSTYPRKPRGGWLFASVRRWSFCCAVEGCRKRHMPPSVRFLGRRVFWSAVVVLGSALAQGLTPGRVRQLRQWLGVSRRTLARWRVWWTQRLPRRAFWREVSGRFDTPIDTMALPASLVERFLPLDAARLLALLKLLLPLTTWSETSAM